MSKGRMKAALAKSVASESVAVNKKGVGDKFKRVEHLLSMAETPSAKAPKSKVAKVVRDTFSMPEDDYALISEVIEQCLDVRAVVTRSQVVRAALRHFASFPTKQKVEAVITTNKLKAGRPAIIRAYNHTV